MASAYADVYNLLQTRNHYWPDWAFFISSKNILSMLISIFLFLLEDCIQGGFWNWRPWWIFWWIWVCCLALFMKNHTPFPFMWFEIFFPKSGVSCTLQLFFMVSTFLTISIIIPTDFGKHGLPGTQDFLTEGKHVKYLLLNFFLFVQNYSWYYPKPPVAGKVIANLN